jgi:hypothetical protein
LSSTQTFVLLVSFLSIYLSIHQSSFLASLPIYHISIFIYFFISLSLYIYTAYTSVYPFIFFFHCPSPGSSRAFPFISSPGLSYLGSDTSFFLPSVALIYWFPQGLFGSGVKSSCSSRPNVNCPFFGHFTHRVPEQNVPCSFLTFESLLLEFMNLLEPKVGHFPNDHQLSRTKNMYSLIKIFMLFCALEKLIEKP